MSLTQAFHVFAGVSENGINTFLQALFTRRPHYLNYGSPSLVRPAQSTRPRWPQFPFRGYRGNSYAVSFRFPDSTYSLQMRVTDAYPPGRESIRLAYQSEPDCGLFYVEFKAGE